MLNEENTWDNAVACENVEGPCELIRRDEILKALRMMKKGKAAGPTGIVSEMFIAEEDCSVEWLTSLRNLIVAQGRIPDDWKSSILTGFQREGRSNGMWILQSDKVTGTCNESDKTCVRKKDQRESKD